MRRSRLAAIAVAILMFVAVPAAIAVYTGTYTPTQAIAPRVLLTPASFACTAPGNSSVSLTWSNTDATTANPYTAGTYVISGYVIDRKINNGSWTNAYLTPGRTATSASDSSFGLLGLGDEIHYRMRSAKSTNWVSGDTATLTAVVTSILIFKHVDCPA